MSHRSISASIAEDCFITLGQSPSPGDIRIMRAQDPELAPFRVLVSGSSLSCAHYLAGVLGRYWPPHLEWYFQCRDRSREIKTFFLKYYSWRFGCGSGWATIGVECQRDQVARERKLAKATVRPASVVTPGESDGKIARSTQSVWRLMNL
jgi:hypothetical protein